MKPLVSLLLALLVAGCGATPESPGETPSAPSRDVEASRGGEEPEEIQETGPSGKAGKPGKSVKNSTTRTGAGATGVADELVKSAGLDSRLKRRIAAWDRDIETGLEAQERVRSQGRAAMEAWLDRLQKKTAAAGPVTVVDLYLKGRMLGKMGRVPEARSAFEEALKREPEFLFAYEGLALCTEREDGTPDAEKAVSYLESAFRIWGDFPRGFLVLGLLQMRKNPRAALATFEKIPEDHPVHGAAFEEVCKCHCMLKQVDVARVMLERALEKNPENLSWRILLGNILLVTGKVSEGEAMFASVLKKAPRNPYALLGMAEVDARKDRIEEAVRKCDEVAQNTALPKHFRAQALRERNRLISGARRRVTARELLDVLCKSPDPARRREAASVLVNVDQKPVLQAFLTRLNVKEEPDEGVRVFAVKAVSRILHASDIPLLQGLLDREKEPSKLVRGAAARALGGVPRRYAPLAALIQALEDPEDYVFRQARAALQEISGERFHMDFGDALPLKKKAEVIAAWRRWLKAESARDEGRKG